MGESLQLQHKTEIEKLQKLLAAEQAKKALPQVLVSPRVSPVYSAPPPNAPQEDILGWVLLHMDQEHGPVWEIARQIFMKIDVDRNGKLEWNNNEIRTFVRNICDHFVIRLPVWEESFWYNL